MSVQIDKLPGPHPTENGTTTRAYRCVSVSSRGAKVSEGPSKISMSVS